MAGLALFLELDDRSASAWERTRSAGVLERFPIYVQGQVEACGCVCRKDGKQDVQT